MNDYIDGMEDGDFEFMEKMMVGFEEPSVVKEITKEDFMVELDAIAESKLEEAAQDFSETEEKLSAISENVDQKEVDEVSKELLKNIEATYVQPSIFSKVKKLSILYKEMKSRVKTEKEESGQLVFVL